jgi:hypothetical protein
VRGESVKRILVGVVVALSGLVGAAVGLSTLNVRAWLYGPLYQTPRYDGVGGGLRALIEGAFAMFAGALVASRFAWLVTGLVSLVLWKKEIPGGRPLAIDLLLLPVFALWMYLVWASW